MRNIHSFSDKSEVKETYPSILCLYLIGGVFVYLYSIPNIFFVYINDTLRLFAIVLFVSYFVMSAGAAYVVYRFQSYKRLEASLFFTTICLWSMVAINLYGIQALVDQPFYQELYINLLWIQLFFILFSWIKWIPIRTRKLVARIVTIILGAFFIFHLLGVFASTKGMGIYVFVFGKDVAVSLIWPGIALFLSGFWTRVIMAGGLDIVTPEERALLIAEEKAREEALKRKLSEEMLSSGRYLEYGELDYEGEEGLTNYREKGSTTFEDVEFLYRENDIRYFSRMDLNPPKELMLYQENGQWYCQTAGQEPEKVLLSEWANDNEKEWRRFEINKREYFEQAIEYRRLVPRFVEIPSDIDASKIDWCD